MQALLHALLLVAGPARAEPLGPHTHQLTIVDECPAADGIEVWVEYRRFPGDPPRLVHDELRDGGLSVDVFGEARYYARSRGKADEQEWPDDGAHEVTVRGRTVRMGAYDVDEQGPVLALRCPRGSMAIAKLRAHVIREDDGLRVVLVRPRGPAHDAGLQRGDLITAVDGEPSITPSALRLALAARRRHALTIQRGEDELDVRVKALR